MSSVDSTGDEKQVMKIQVVKVQRAWHLDNANDPLDRDDGNLLPEACIYCIRETT